MIRRPHRALIAIGVAVLAILLHLVGILRPLEDGVRWTLEPAARALAYFGIKTGSQTRSAPDASTLQAQVADLQARLSTMSVDYVKLKALEEENRSLKETAKFLTDSGYDHVGARIIARSADPQNATVLIDRGAADGLETGMAVIVNDGVFVGKISALEEHVATVMLVSDRRSRIAVSPAGEHRLFGMVEGEGNGVAKLTLVPQNEPLAPDDIITTAGTEEKIPPNLAIGFVNTIEGTQTDPFKTATLEPLIQPDRLDLVVVLRPDALRPTPSAQ